MRVSPLRADNSADHWHVGIGLIHPATACRTTLQKTPARGEESRYRRSRGLAGGGTCARAFAHCDKMLIRYPLISGLNGAPAGKSGLLGRKPRKASFRSLKSNKPKGIPAAAGAAGPFRAGCGPERAEPVGRRGASGDSRTWFQGLLRGRRPRAKIRSSCQLTYQ